MSEAYTSSPFASLMLEDRVAATRKIMRRRRREIGAAQKAYERAVLRRDRLRAQHRLKAAQNNLASWAAYAAKGYPRVRGAVIQP